MTDVEWLSGVQGWPRCQVLVISDRNNDVAEVATKVLGDASGKAVFLPADLTGKAYDDVAVPAEGLAFGGTDIASSNARAYAWQSGLLMRQGQR